MVVGSAINQDEFILNRLPIKQELLIGANLIMEKIYQMVPNFEQDNNINQFNNHLKSSIQLLDKYTKSHQLLNITEISAISFLLNHPVLMDVLIRNLKLPVKVLANAISR
jgi:hypothetical protein